MASSKTNGNKVGKTQGGPVTPAKTAKITLGDLIAAAFDTVGNEVKDVARLLSSRELVKTTGRRIVLVQ